jgi:hypothetical protein
VSADVTIGASAVEDAPLDYPIPGAAELILKFLTASYDGTAASGPFVPTIQLLVGATVVAGSFPLGQQLAAGALADVTWFPGVAGKGTVTPSTTFHGCRAVCLGPDLTGTVSVAMGSNAVVGVGTHFTTELVAGSIYDLRFYLDNDESLIVQTITDDTHLTTTTNALANHAGSTVTVDQVIQNDTYTAVKYQGVDFFDTDDFHFRSNANLTGTVTKVAGGVTITGVGTHFTSELSVNQAFLVPGGGGTDCVLVRSIESDTSLTVWPNRPVGYSAAGQTATLDPSVLGIPAGLGGMYIVVAQVDFRNTSDGSERADTIFINLEPSHAKGLYSSDSQFYAPTAVSGESVWTTTMVALLQDGDIVRDFVVQQVGSTLGLTPTYGLSVVRVGV